LAITLVVLSHASVPGFTGGFVGVDVFFVISGFLITGILVAELKECARIDYFSFYARRMRRLLPAFAAMMLAVVIACNLLLPVRGWLSQAEPLTWAAVWLSNFFFAFAKYGYFGQQARDSIALHTWSLGVEEQFYLVWPLLLFLLWRWSRGNPGRLTAALAVTTAVGFAGCLVATAHAPVQAYYLMPSRLWELALGAWGVFLLDQFRTRIPSAVATLLGNFGLGAIAVGLWVIDDRVKYPSVYTALPTLGTFALLLGGDTGGAGGWVTRTLASPVMTLLGRISYSWYLWHWPVLLLGRARGLDISGSQGVALVGLSLLLACASYFGIEEPTRRTPIRRSRRIVAIGLAGTAVLALVGQAWMSSARSIEQFSRLHPTSFADRLAQMIEMPAIYGIPHCDDWYASSKVVPCGVSSGDAARGTAVIFGDSVGVQWYPAFLKILQAQGLTVLVITKASCPMVDKSYFYPPINRIFSECDTWRSAALDYIVQLKPRVVILGSSGEYDFSPADWREGTMRVISRLARVADQVYVIAPTPILPFDGPGCLAAEGASKPIAELEHLCTVPLRSVENEKVIDVLREVASAVDVRFVYLNDLVCLSGTCRAWQNGKLTYRDSQHLNGGFVAGLANEMTARMPGLAAAVAADTSSAKRTDH
jgi:peptidoglycan/LPS O-acetylase OafA/YrhL